MSSQAWDLQVGYRFELVICVFGIDRTATISKIIFDVVAVRSTLFAIHACVDGPSSSLLGPSKKKHVGRTATCRAAQRWRIGRYSTAIVWVRIQRCVLGEYSYYFQFYYYYHYLHQPRRVSNCLCVWVFVCLFGSLNHSSLCLNSSRGAVQLHQRHRQDWKAHGFAEAVRWS